MYFLKMSAIAYHRGLIEIIIFKVVFVISNFYLFLNYLKCSDIFRLKQMEEERLHNTGASNTLPYVKDASGKPLNMDLDASVDEHISRLVEERDTLLRTGVYTTQDKIIMELERQIRDSIGHKGS